MTDTHDTTPQDGPGGPVGGEGATLAATPKKGRSGRVGKRGGHRGKASVSSRDQVNTNERLEFNTKVASKAAAGAHRMIEWALSVFVKPEGAGLDERHTAAKILEKATLSHERSNAMIRLNANLPTAIGKAETKTDGKLTVEHTTTEEALVSAERELGIRLDRAREGALSVSTPLSSGHGPS